MTAAKSIRRCLPSLRRLVSPDHVQLYQSDALESFWAINYAWFGLLVRQSRVVGGEPMLSQVSERLQRGRVKNDASFCRVVIDRNL